MDVRMPTIVVGVDQVEPSRAALGWAAREAARRSGAVHVVHCEQYPLTGEALLGAYSAQVLERVDELGREVLAQAVQVVRQEAAAEVWDGVVVRTTLVHDRPRAGLLRFARVADLVVTGARRRSGARTGVLAGVELGSTSLFLASHAPCPVVVTRRQAEPRACGVVVGHDGSAAAEAALEWAAAHAQSRAEPLTVVHAWQPPNPRTQPAGREPDDDPAGASGGADDGAADGPDEGPGEEGSRRQTTRSSAEDAARRVREAYPQLDVGADVVENSYASDAVLAAAEHASLVVVGSRGRGAFATALLGSTSHAVLHRATCPVAVVPDFATAGWGRRSRPAALDLR